MSGSRVAVYDPLPAYRDGLATALRAGGYVPETPNDLLTWAREPGRRGMVATLDLAHDRVLLGSLCRANDELVLICLAISPDGKAVRALDLR